MSHEREVRDYPAGEQDRLQRAGMSDSGLQGEGEREPIQSVSIAGAPMSDHRSVQCDWRRGGNSHRFLFQMARSHLLILLVPMAVLALVLWFALQTGEREAVRIHERQVVHVQQLADSWAGEVKTTAIQLAFDPMVRAVLGRSQPGTPGFFNVWELADRLPSYGLLDDFVVGVYIFIRESDIGVTSGSAFQGIPLFFREVLRYDGPVPAPWEQTLWQQFHSGRVLPAANVRIDGHPRRVIPYLQSIPIDRRGDPRGVVFVLMDEYRILELLQQASLPESSILVGNGSGELITSLVRPGLDAVPRPAELQDPERWPRDTMVSHAHSETHDWDFYALSPTRLVRTAAHRIGAIWAIAIAVITVVGVLSAYLTSLAVARPIDEALDRLRVEFGAGGWHAGTGEFEMVAEGLNALLKSNAALRRDVNHLIALARHSFLYQMAHDELIAGDQRVRTAIGAEPQFPNERHVVSVCELLPGDPRSAESVREALRTALVAELQDRVESYELGDRRLVSIMSSRENGDRACMAALTSSCEHVVETVCDGWRGKVVVACGRVFGDLSEAGQSFADAMQVLLYRHLCEGGPVLWVSSLPSASANYHYAIETEFALVNAVRAADESEVRNILQEIRDENLRSRVLAPATLTELLNALRASIGRQLAQLVESGAIDEQTAALPAVDAMHEAMKEMALDNAFDELESAYIQACELVAHADQLRQDEFSRELAAYLEDSYHEVDLNLYKVAKNFELSEHALYRFFKSHLNESFAAYLQNLRITNAQELLYDSQLTVKAIATMVGYASDTSFRRSFKRVTGLTPLEFREAIRPPVHAASG